MIINDPDPQFLKLLRDQGESYLPFATCFVKLFEAE